MSEFRPNNNNKKPHGKGGRVDVAPRPSTPLGNPFASLGELDALKHLRVPEPPPAPKAPPVVAKTPPVAHPIAPRQKAPKPIPPVIPIGSKGRLILRREKKDRGGKTVVVVYGFKELPNFSAAAIADLSRDLKNKLGCGGSFDRQEIVLQGDRAGAVATTLESMGYRVDGVREDGPPG